MDREALVALATTLGIVVTEEMEDAEIAAKITSEVNDVIVPLNDVQNQVDKRRSFATEFPDEYEKYQKLLERDELHEARLFAERWERFEIEENGARRKTTQGFAARTLSHIEDIHLKMARRQLTVDDVANLLDSIATAGTVDFSEKGSSRSPEETSVEGLSIKEVRQQFADEVARVMEEDSVDRKAAIKIVSGRNPELAEAYKTGHLRR